MNQKKIILAIYLVIMLILGLTIYNQNVKSKKTIVTPVTVGLHNPAYFYSSSQHLLVGNGQSYIFRSQPGKPFSIYEVFEDETEVFVVTSHDLPLEDGEKEPVFEAVLDTVEGSYYTLDSDYSVNIYSSSDSVVTIVDTPRQFNNDLVIFLLVAVMIIFSMIFWASYM